MIRKDTLGIRARLQRGRKQAQKRLGLQPLGRYRFSCYSPLDYAANRFRPVLLVAFFFLLAPVMEAQ